MKKEKQNQTVYYTSTMPILIRRATYDVNLDPWTKEYLGENPKPATTLNQTPCSANTIRALRMLHLLQKNFKTYRRILKRQYCWK
jgi:hypothetical protein